MYKLSITAVAAACGVASGQARIFADSYDMLNGQTGSFTYWDDTYNGSGSTTTSLAPLSGGTGDLTDRVIATQNWNVDPGAYVGWSSVDPEITFHFGRDVQIDRVVVYFDDSNGSGGVLPPASFLITPDAGPAQSFTVTDEPSGAPYSLDMAINVTTQDLVVQAIDGSTGRWIMISEVEFYGVPTPGAATALGAFGLLAGRRRR